MGTEKKHHINVPNLTKRDITNIAEKLLKSAQKTGTFPVDIEYIIERHLKLAIIPVNGLKKQQGIDAYITSNFTIFVDEQQYSESSVRYRFSVAHELAHYILHAQAYKDLHIDSVNEHVRIQNQISNDDIKRIESQAYRFAGCILLPGSSFSPVVKSVLNSNNLTNMSITDAYKAIEQIAVDFQVSKDVVQRQLMYFYPETYSEIQNILA